MTATVPRPRRMEVQMATPTKDPNHRACVQEACALFDCGVGHGSTLRVGGQRRGLPLPLRRANEVTKDLQPDISPAAAEKFLESWVHGSQTAKCSSSSSSVTRVSIWIWRAGEGKPSRLTCVSKSVQHRSRGSAPGRLPPTLPSAARESYEGLSKRVRPQRERAEAALGNPLRSGRINVESSGQSTRTEWLVCQRFDVVTPSVFQIIKTGENVVPVVGIALLTQIRSPAARRASFRLAT